MRYGKRQLHKRILYSPFSAIALLVLSVVMARAAWGISEKAAVGERRLEQAKSELSKLEARQNDLTAKVAYLSTEEGMQSELRTKFRAVKPGEFVDVIVDSEKSSASQTDILAAALQASSTDVGFFGKLLRMIGL